MLAKLFLKPRELTKYIFVIFFLQIIQDITEKQKILFVELFQMHKHLWDYFLYLSLFPRNMRKFNVSNITIDFSKKILFQKVGFWENPVSRILKKKPLFCYFSQCFNCLVSTERCENSHSE